MAPEIGVAPWYHCTVAGLPLADAANVTVEPIWLVWLTGDVTITGAEIKFTSSSAISTAAVAVEESKKTSVVFVELAVKAS